MSNLTLLEVKEAKEVLHSEISTALLKFLHTTGVVPSVEIKSYSFEIDSDEQPIVHSFEVKINASI
jgi:hypothetical protein